MHDTTPAEIMRLLRQIADDVRELRNDSTHTKRQIGALPRADMLPTLAHAIYDARGDRLFSVGELLLAAEARQAHALRDAIANVTIGATDAAKKLGQALRKAQMENLHGLHVVRVGEDKQGVIWQVALHKQSPVTFSDSVMR